MTYCLGILSKDGIAGLANTSNTFRNDFTVTEKYRYGSKERPFIFYHIYQDKGSVYDKMQMSITLKNEA